MKKTVLFLCTTNSCRSQMAEGLLRALAGDQFESYSAGAVASPVHPLAKEVMSQIGVDISTHRSKTVEELLNQEFDYVITVCGEHAKKICPLFPGKAGRRLHWSFADPEEAAGNEEELLAVFREVRDAIRGRLEEFVEQCKEPE